MSGYTVEQIETAARGAHEVNRVFCREVMDDNSHLPWKHAPDWVKRSAYDGVEAIIADPTMPPAGSHESWSKMKRGEGWVWGERKDPVAKTHPCLVPFERLALADRVKDTLFGVVVRTALGIDHHASIDVATVPQFYTGQRGQS
jgi:hypothetical protein